MKLQKIRILIVEDDRYFRLALKHLLQDYGIIDEADSEESARELLHHNYYDLALIDMQLDREDSGINILELAKSNRIHSIILSSNTDEAITEKAYQVGCDHFLSKIYYKDSLVPYVVKFIKNQKHEILHQFIKDEFITQDKELIQSLKQLTEINLKNRHIFITGETGVGKTLIGKLLHRIHHSESEPFVHLNCSEIPENLLEAELFGSKKGAYTGATQDKKGKLELANHGTLFLDEVATMPKSMQQKLLKAIDEKSFYPVGSNQPVTSNFTLITATCEDLFSKIEKNEFRKDLFFRISGLNLHLKPLRERQEDIILLAKHFIENSPRRVVIKEEALNELAQFSWQGNVRELKKTIELLSLKSSGIITKENLPKQISLNSSLRTGTGLSESQLSFIQENGLRKFIQNIETEVVKNSLERNKGKVTHCIKELKISASALYRIMDQVSL
jgi:DNA-binding NtrC family response regulator